MKDHQQTVLAWASQHRGWIRIIRDLTIIVFLVVANIQLYRLVHRPVAHLPRPLPEQSSAFHYHEPQAAINIQPGAGLPQSKPSPLLDDPRRGASPDSLPETAQAVGPSFGSRQQPSVRSKAEALRGDLASLHLEIERAAAQQPVDCAVDWRQMVRHASEALQRRGWLVQGGHVYEFGVFKGASMRALSADLQPDFMCALSQRGGF
mmetsp:Transcript_4371/g.10352  ORF Transcript_4371/g.10352 Transcript_4371/m.10352 type:complete len:206 (-) Transcript_4371:1123-1740(-)